MVMYGETFYRRHTALTLTAVSKQFPLETKKSNIGSIKYQRTITISVKNI